LSEQFSNGTLRLVLDSVLYFLLMSKESSEKEVSEIEENFLDSLSFYEL
jgi:hypothetical protein